MPKQREINQNSLIMMLVTRICILYIMKNSKCITYNLVEAGIMIFELSRTMVIIYPLVLIHSSNKSSNFHFIWKSNLFRSTRAKCHSNKSESDFTQNISKNLIFKIFKSRPSLWMKLSKTSIWGILVGIDLITIE